MLSFRRVLESAAAGKGIARSAVEELADVVPLGTEAARLLLLGFPLRVALRPLVEGANEEVSMIASLVVTAPRSSVAVVGRDGGTLAATLERWVKARESRALEQKVLRFRSLLTAGVLGGVAGMIATLGPLVGGIGLQGVALGAGRLMPCAAAMTAVSSGVLGAFMSGRRLYLSIGVSLAAFAVVGAFASPLASLTPSALWGVK